MGGVPPPCSPSHDHDSFVRISYLLFPFFSHICALFCAILHFLTRIKYATLFFSSDSALFGKNTRVGNESVWQLCCLGEFLVISMIHLHSSAVVARCVLD